MPPSAVGYASVPYAILHVDLDGIVVDHGRDVVIYPVSADLVVKAGYRITPVEEHRPGQRVTGLTLVQSGIDASVQLHALQPVQNKPRALNAAQLAQGDGQTVLAEVAPELPEHQRGRHGALLYGGGKP